MATLAGFLSFVRTSMGISTVVLPDDTAAIGDSYALALEIVNEILPLVSTLIYDQAVYNLAGDTLVNIASDVSVTNASITWAANTATVTTAAAHGFTTGTSVLVAGTAPAAYTTAGTVSVIVTGATTYTYPLTPSPGTTPATQAGTSSLTFFAELRAKWGINSFVPGVVQSSSDENTAESLLVPDAFKGFTLGDLQNLKTPWGRQYLAYAQRCGPLWGLT